VMLIEIVLAAVDLDNEMMLHADKIDNVTFARRLTPEVKSALAPCSQVNPKFHLLRRHPLA
jgi:hypothetical protein